MSDPSLLPEGLAVGAGLAALGAWAFTGPDEPLAWRELRFPSGLRADQVEAVLGRVASETSPVVFVIEAHAQAIRFLLGARSGSIDALTSTVTGVAPEVRVDDASGNGCTTPPTHGVRAWWPGRWPLLRVGDAGLAIAGLLGSLTTVRQSERVRLVVRLRPSGRVAWPEHGAVGEMRTKLAGPLLRTELLLTITAKPDARARQLSRGIIASLQTLNGPVSRLRVRRLSAKRASRATEGATRTRSWWLTPRTLLSPREIVPIIGWPLGAPRIEGITYGSAPRFMPSPELPQRAAATTRTFALSTWPRTQGQPLTAPATASTLHTACIGGTGSGKSTVIANLALADINAGRGALVVDLKGDVVLDLLRRIPEHRHQDVVLLDPASGGLQPGLTLFPAGADRDLVVETLERACEQIWDQAWGVRIAHYLRLSLRTLGAVNGATLLQLPLLFDPGFRRRVLRSSSIDALTQREWQRFAALSPAEQAVHAGPLLTRLDQLLSRKHVRHLLGQPNPRLHFGEVLARGRIVLARFPVGLLGLSTSRLLVSCLLSQFFAAVEARAALPERKRTIYNAYLDEIAAVGSTPLGLEGALERCRAHGVGVMLAPQHLGQLSPSLRASLLANVGSLVTFALGADEAKAVARELPGVTAEQIQLLGRHEVIAKLALAPGHTTAPMTGRTLPLEAPCTDPDAIRRVAGDRFGVELDAVDRALAELVGLPTSEGREPDRDIGARRRAS